MKDITHYFTDLPKNSENAVVALKEVINERAKIDDTSIVNDHSRAKRKRGRVKIKITRKSNESSVCDIINNSSDLVDKTPSPYPKQKSKQIDPGEDTPKKKILLKPSEINEKLSVKKSNKKNKNNIHLENESLKFIPKIIDNIGEKKEQINCCSETNNMKNQEETDVLNKKKNKRKKEQTEKLIKLADKKGYSKRKLIEEEEAVKIEKQLEKRIKLFTAEPHKNTETLHSDENIPKNDSNSTKRSSNLLNYFSKATPEQVEKERILKSKLTVRAEIHTPQNSHLFPHFISEKKIIEAPKKVESNSKQLHEKFDEILLLQSETLMLTSKKNKSKSLQLQSKPKWSMKIQLQSDNNIHVTEISDDEIFTPTILTTLEKKENKINEKIPKILLPLKNKKEDLSNSLDSCNKNRKEEKKCFKIDNREISKIENTKIEDNINLKNYSVIAQHKLNNISSKSIEDDCQIIEENSLKRKPNKKLAPLFAKKIKPSLETIAARRSFLKSDLHENDNGNEERKPITLGPTTLPFPRISHITQLPLQIAFNSKFNFQLKTDKIFKPIFNLSQVKFMPKSNKTTNMHDNLYKCVKSDVDAVLSEVGLYCTDVQALWKSISKLSKCNNSKRTKKSKRGTEKNNLKIINNSLNNELNNSPWIDKYKPNNSAEIVDNEDAVLKLKYWLSSWKVLKTNEDYSSGEEFYTSDCSMSSNLENNQVAVLIGPHGCGKTASVYAVAQELGYKVLEVNASSKRPGKKILKEFEEATKSHRVKKSNLKDIFTSASKNNKEIKEISQNSLILMEDVDLVFEEDEGFISATFQLASNTKRPIVMTLRDTCSHLSKMAPQQFRINFEPVRSKKASAILQLITLAETGCKLSQQCANVLCQNGDFRRSLLQLQYLLISGKKHVSSISLAVNNLSWKDMQTYIYKPALKADKNKKKKISNDNVVNDTLDYLVNKLDNFSLISRLTNIEDPTCHLIDLKSEPSISLVENKSPYSSLRDVSLEIDNWLNEAMRKSIVNNSNKSNNQSSSNQCQFFTKKQINIGVDTALSQIASNTLDRRALAVDYLSSIRTICRAEEIRNQLNSKRGNRFFHYLQSSKLSTGTTKLNNILSAACQMLQEKSTTVTET